MLKERYNTGLCCMFVAYYTDGHAFQVLFKVNNVTHINAQEGKVKGK